MGGSFGYPLITVIAHRMEDYLSSLSELREEHVADIQAFVDATGDALAGPGERPGDQNAADVVRRLPVNRVHIDTAQVAKRDVEILLAMPQGAATRIVTRELQACGYRVSTVQSSLEAIEFVVRTRPDMVIASAVVDELSGVDLAAALAAMPTTRTSPVGLASSFAKDHVELSELSESVALLRKGKDFAEDLGQALARFDVF